MIRFVIGLSNLTESPLWLTLGHLLLLKIRTFLAWHCSLAGCNASMSVGEVPLVTLHVLRTWSSHRESVECNEEANTYSEATLPFSHHYDKWTTLDWHYQAPRSFGRLMEHSHAPEHTRSCLSPCLSNDYTGAVIESYRKLRQKEQEREMGKVEAFVAK